MSFAFPAPDHAEMAAEVVGIIIPALAKKAGYSSAQRTQAAANQETSIVRALRYWTDLSPHPVSQPLSHPIHRSLFSLTGCTSVLISSCVC